MDYSVMVLLIVVVASVFLFLVLREFFCWYFKINERLKLMKELNENTKLIVKANGKEPFELPKDETPWWKDKSTSKKTE